MISARMYGTACSTIGGAMPMDVKAERKNHAGNASSGVSAMLR